MSTFQSFAEMSKDGVDGLPIIFIGVGHRRFEMYANPALLTDFRVVRDRVTVVSLEFGRVGTNHCSPCFPKEGRSHLEDRGTKPLAFDSYGK